MSRIVKIMLAGVAVYWAAVPVLSQSPETKRPSFEVVSIKSNNSGATNSGSSSNQIFRANNLSTRALIRQAYRVQDFQIIGAPGWLDADRFDIEGRPEAGAIPTQRGPRDPNVIDPMTLMVQSMLEDRFQLKLHHETRELPIYTLVIAKDGPKVKASEEAPPQPDAVPTGAGAGPGRAQQGIANPGRGSTYTSVNSEKGELNSKAVGITSLINFLAGQMRRPVIDKTGLTGLFDFHVIWTPDRNPAATAPTAAGGNAPLPTSDPGPSLFTAIQEQLGLKLESTKGPVDVIVIDSIQKPSEN